MKEYKLQISCSPKDNIGFAFRIDGKDVELPDLNADDARNIRSILDSVSMKLYHDEFMKKYGECPTCDVIARKD